MKPSDDCHEIGEWLRSHKPEITAPADMETRILRAIRDDAQPKHVSRPWIWWLLPPAAACLLLVLLPHQEKPETTVETKAAASGNGTAGLLETTNDPLLAESKALGRDVQRASGFLIHCLPSVGGEER